jgi:predicted transport protein
MASIASKQEREQLQEEIKTIAKEVTKETEKVMVAFRREANEYAKLRTVESNPLLRLFLKQNHAK